MLLDHFSKVADVLVSLRKQEGQALVFLLVDKFPVTSKVLIRGRPYK